MLFGFEDYERCDMYKKFVSISFIHSGLVELVNTSKIDGSLSSLVCFAYEFDYV